MSVTVSGDEGSEGVCKTAVLIRRLRIENQQGLHARPSVYIVRLLQGTKSTVTFTYKRQTVAANSVLGLLMLAAPKNAWITVSVDGPDAQEVIEKLEEAFRQRFGEQG
jgi:phosphocarrier protein